MPRSHSGRSNSRTSKVEDTLADVTYAMGHDMEQRMMAMEKRLGRVEESLTSVHSEFAKQAAQIHAWELAKQLSQAQSGKGRSAGSCRPSTAPYLTRTARLTAQAQQRRRLSVESPQRSSFDSVTSSCPPSVKLEAGASSSRAGSSKVSEVHSEGDEDHTPEEAVVDTVSEVTTMRTTRFALAGSDPDFSLYYLNRSIWDAAIFIGTPELGNGGSLMVFIGLCLNIVLQAIFILIVMSSLVKDAFTEEELRGLKAWRSRVAHDARFVPDSPRFSMVDRVCAQDATLELATEQASRLSLIRDYLPPPEEGLAHYLPGYVMCTLAMIVWDLCVLKEIFNIVNCLGALRQLPQGRTRWSTVNKTGCRQEIHSVSPSRRLGSMLVMVLRLAVACMVAVMGNIYLCYTTSMADLLLNAMALEVVIDIDELIFRAMAPVCAAELLSNLGPLKMRHWPQWQGADLKAVAAPMMLAALVFFSGVWWLAPTVANLRNANQTICGGNLSFSFEMNGLGMTLVGGLESFSKDVAYSTGDLRQRAVHEVMESVPQQEWQYALVSASHGRNQHIVKQATVNKLLATVEDIYRVHNVSCFDVLEAKWTRSALPNVIANQAAVFPHYLAHFLGRSQPVHRCEDVRSLCVMRQNTPYRIVTLLRALCPVTCGCNSLQSGTFWVAKEFGCPGGCHVATVKKERSETPCTDVSPHNVSDPRRQGMLSYMREIAIVTGGRLNVTSMFLREGCDMLKLIVADNAIALDSLCVPSHERGTFLSMSGRADPFNWEVFKPLTHMCPMQCNCGGLLVPGGRRPPDSFCPRSCILCPWAMRIPLKETDRDPKCAVPSPFSQNLLPPVSTDARCCFLLKEAVRIVQILGANSIEVAVAAIADMVLGDLNLYARLRWHLCHSCRDTCWKSFEGVLDPATNFSFVRADFCSDVLGEAVLARYSPPKTGTN